MTAATMRPSAPDACDCDVYPRCGHDLGAPPASREVPTVPAPGPCQRAALVAALQRHEAALWDIARLQEGMPAEEFAAGLEDYRAERVRLRAMRTAD